MSDEKEPDLPKSKKTGRTRKAPKSRFKEGNEHRWQPGQSGNPSGRPKAEMRLVSRALLDQLSWRAPAALCKLLGLPETSSQAQCLAATLIRRATKGDTNAARLLMELVGESGRNAFTLSFDSDGDSEYAAGPRLVVNFVSSKSDLEKRIAERKIIDHPQRDPDPEAAAAMQEAAGTVSHREAEPEILPPPPSSSSRNTFAALAAPTPAPESAQKIRERVYKKLGY